MLLNFGHDGKKKTFAEEHKKHEASNLFSETKKCNKTIKGYCSVRAKERRFDEGKGARSCFRCDHCVSRGVISISFLPHQLNNLTLQHLIGVHN